jgi:hypothetical protein
MARAKFLGDENLKNLNPFELEFPGDVLLEISRKIEYDLYREHQFRIRVLQLVLLIVGDDLRDTTVANIVRTIGYRYDEIDALLLSASQQRKSRAGYSFESHISRMLLDGGIPFASQKLVASNRARPDFILPSMKLYKDKTRSRSDALVLSAKTTLRERWKQVMDEISNCDLFLATFDEKITSDAIAQMATRGIWLVVPEAMKKSTSAEYSKSPNVIGFKTFFSDVIRKEKWPAWVYRGIIKSITV